jgi:anti-sigma regulatory factor (Ser/Thr protein kinase)
MNDSNLKEVTAVQVLMKKLDSDVRNFIVRHVEEHPKDIARLTARRFKISRVAVGRHLRDLTKDGILVATGVTKDRVYTLGKLLDEVIQLEVTAALNEGDIWRERIAPLLRGVPENVFLICSWGLTEMVNNVIDHSQSKDLIIQIALTAVSIEIAVIDHGVGIFNNIQQKMGYSDPRHALLELTKGKLTTDTERHSGYGIFFTSRAFDTFSISSGTLFFLRKNDGDQWFIETQEQESVAGTAIRMKIGLHATHTIQQVLDRYTTDFNEGFTRTHVPLSLAKYEGEQLISRSQARRVLARAEKFSELFLDFKGIKMIGQAFADEIFRVFPKSHPETRIVHIGANKEVEKMIRLAKAGLKQDEKADKSKEAKS